MNRGNFNGEEQFCFSNFRVGEKIGQGAFSEVYIAVHRTTFTRYALKRVDLSNVSSSILQNLEKEVEIHQKIDHESIVRFHGQFLHQNHLFLVLEYLQGGNLFQYIKNNCPLDPLEIRSYFKQIAHAFRYLHSKGIVMRDLKPENIILSDCRKNAKLCDFGWSSYIEDKEWLNQMAGTYVYMAPEALNSQMQGFETDIWSLGILLFELYHGYEPFQGADPKTVLKKVLTKKIPFDETLIDQSAIKLI